MKTVFTKDGVEVEKGTNKYKGHIFYDEDGGKYKCLGYFPKLDDCVYENLQTGKEVVGCMDGFYYNNPTEKSDDDKWDEMVRNNNGRLPDWYAKGSTVEGGFDEKAYHLEERAKKQLGVGIGISDINKALKRYENENSQNAVYQSNKLRQLKSEMEALILHYEDESNAKDINKYAKGSTVKDEEQDLYEKILKRYSDYKTSKKGESVWVVNRSLEYTKGSETYSTSSILDKIEWVKRQGFIFNLKASSRDKATLVYKKERQKGGNIYVDTYSFELVQLMKNGGDIKYAKGSTVKGGKFVIMQEGVRGDLKHLPRYQQVRFIADKSGYSSGANNYIWEEVNKRDIIIFSTEEKAEDFISRFLKSKAKVVPYKTYEMFFQQYLLAKFISKIQELIKTAEDFEWEADISYKYRKDEEVKEQMWEAEKYRNLAKDLVKEYNAENKTNFDIVDWKNPNLLEASLSAIGSEKYAKGSTIKGSAFTFQGLDKRFQKLDWRDTTEAYYGLDFTPFMSVVEEYIEQSKSSQGLDSHFEKLGWRDTTEAYYGLDFTPFMSEIENYATSKYAKGGSVNGFNYTIGGL